MMPHSIHIEMRELDDCKTGKNRELAEDLHHTPCLTVHAS